MGLPKNDGKKGVFIEIDGVRKTENEWRALHKELDRLFGKSATQILPALPVKREEFLGYPTIGPLYAPRAGEPAGAWPTIICEAH